VRALLTCRCFSKKKNETKDESEPAAQWKKAIQDEASLYNPNYTAASRDEINIAQLFEPLSKDEAVLKKVLIQGRAGIGKTVLCQYLATQWASDEKKLLRDRFEAIFWLQLRDIVSDFPKKQAPGDLMTFLWKVLQKYCLQGDYWQDLTKKEAESREEALLEYLKQSSTKILFILDGYDEVASELNGQYPHLKPLLEAIFQYDNVLLSSRPLPDMKYDSQGQSSLEIGEEHVTFQRTVECMGFTDDNIQAFVERYFSEQKKPQALRDEWKLEP